MDPQDDEPDLGDEDRSPALERALDRVRRRASRLPADLAAVRAGAQRWDDRTRTTSFVPQAETVALDTRRHLSTLGVTATRTLVALLVLVAGPSVGLLLLLAVLCSLWAQVRFKPRLRTTLIVSGVATAGVVVLLVLAGPVLTGALLLLWALEDLADWYVDRLVVTDRRIYRLHGVLTRHSPSIALTSIAYIDAAVPPMGRLLGYGTLKLDSVAQRDDPLSRLPFIPDVVAVSHEVLRLRSKVLPAFPPQH